MIKQWLLYIKKKDWFTAVVGTYCLFFWEKISVEKKFEKNVENLNVWKIVRYTCILYKIVKYVIYYVKTLHF